MKKINVEGFKINVNAEGYISLTDLAKKTNPDSPATPIQRWLRNQSTLLFMETWEKVHNQNFNLDQMVQFRLYATENRNSITPKKYITQTNAMGLMSKSGRHGGGTFAHSDIAINFCYWLSPEFQVYFIQEFQRLKTEEAKQLNIEWNIRRELAKAHYPMLKEAVIQNLPAGKKKAGFYLADEADLINELVFGLTAKQWRKKYPDLKGNMRDNATVEQLLLVSDLQIVDSLLLKWDCDKQLRTDILEKFANDLRVHFSESMAVQRVKEIQDRALK